MMSGDEPDTKKQKSCSEQNSSEGCLFAYGNPLLDIIAETDQDFLAKYGLEANNSILADEKTKPIFDEIVDKYTVDYVPGGATLNAVRVAQWLLPETKQATTFTGCIGNDKFGNIMKEKASAENVKTLFMHHDDQPTGTCAVLITGKNRSLVANLAAADHFKKSHFDEKERWSYVEKAQCYYVSGFPLTVSPETMLLMASHAAEKNKVFTMNLSAPFLINFFKEPMMKVLPYVDILFGNETEAATFAKEHKFETEDVKEIAKKIANLDKVNKTRKRIVVITQGANPTIIAQADGDVKEFPVLPVKPDDIVDTNGAGDAFVGGYLAQLVKGTSREECVRSAHYAASVIIQQSGVTLAKPHSFK